MSGKPSLWWRNTQFAAGSRRSRIAVVKPADAGQSDDVAAVGPICRSTVTLRPGERPRVLSWARSSRYRASAGSTTGTPERLISRSNEYFATTGVHAC